MEISIVSIIPHLPVEFNKKSKKFTYKQHSLYKKLSNVHILIIKFILIKILKQNYFLFLKKKIDGAYIRFNYTNRATNTILFYLNLKKNLFKTVYS